MKLQSITLVRGRISSDMNVNIHPRCTGLNFIISAASGIDRTKAACEIDSAHLSKTGKTLTVTFIGGEVQKVKVYGIYESENGYNEPKAVIRSQEYENQIQEQTRQEERQREIYLTAWSLKTQVVKNMKARVHSTI